MNEMLKALYNSFYTPLKTETLKQEIESCHQQLIDRLEKPERKLVLRIIDAGSQITETISVDSFLCGYQLALRMSNELNRYARERPVLDKTSKQGAHTESSAKEQS